MCFCNLKQSESLIFRSGSRPSSRERHAEFDNYEVRRTPSRGESPNGSRHSSLNRSRRSRERSGRMSPQGTGRSPSYRGQSPSYRGHREHGTQQEFQQQGSPVSGDIAHQIQSIIRGELRKMMEVGFLYMYMYQTNYMYIYVYISIIIIFQKFQDCKPWKTFKCFPSGKTFYIKSTNFMMLFAF